MVDKEVTEGTALVEVAFKGSEEGVERRAADGEIEAGEGRKGVEAEEADDVLDAVAFEDVEARERPAFVNEVLSHSVNDRREEASVVIDEVKVEPVQGECFAAREIEHHEEFGDGRHCVRDRADNGVVGCAVEQGVVEEAGNVAGVVSGDVELARARGIDVCGGREHGRQGAIEEHRVFVRFIKAVEAIHCAERQPGFWRGQRLLRGKTVELWWG